MKREQTEGTAGGDHLGSSSTLTNGSGNVVGRERYSAFGERRRLDNAALTDQLYTGQRYNSLSALYHYNSGKSAGRFYDPLLARFVMADPVTPPGSQGLNRYSHTFNNPIKYTDPDGHCPMCVTAALGAAAGASIAYGSQVVANISRDGVSGKAFSDVSWSAVGAGAVAGGVGGATFGVGLAVGEAIALSAGISSASGAVATAVGATTVGISGAAAGQTSRLATNAYYHRELTQGLGQVDDMVVDAALSLVSFKALGGNYNEVLPSDLTAPGAFARGSVAATGPKTTASQREAVQKIGDEFGCHHCGTGQPGTPSGRWIFDHIPPNHTAAGAPQQGYPQCEACRVAQSHYLRWGNRSSLVPHAMDSWRPYQSWAPLWQIYDSE